MDDADATDIQSAMSIVADLVRMQGVSPMSDHEYAKGRGDKLFQQSA